MTAADQSSGTARVTLTDVAALAGVSAGTASKALNGRGRMRPETRQRVLDAAERLNFRPNQLAQSLLSGRSWTVGLITTDGIGRFSHPRAARRGGRSRRRKISVLLCDTRGDAIREQHYLRTLIARRIDGLIVTGRRTDPRPPLAGPIDVPTVYAFTPSADPDDISVASDDEGGARLAVEHLIGTGRSRIAHVTGPAHHAAAADRARHAVNCWPRPGSPCPRAGSTRRLERGMGPAGGRAPSWPPRPTPTPSSAATTRSPAASPTPCANRAVTSPRTSPSSATTTGTPWPWPPARPSPPST